MHWTYLQVTFSMKWHIKEYFNNNLILYQIDQHIFLHPSPTVKYIRYVHKLFPLKCINLSK